MVLLFDNTNDNVNDFNFNYDTYSNSNEIIKPITPTKVHDYITSDPVSKQFNTFVTSSTNLLESIFENVNHKKFRVLILN